MSARRGRMGASRRNPPPHRGGSIWTPTAAISPKFWYRSNVTLDTADVQTWVDDYAVIGDATTPGGAPAWDAEDADFGTAAIFTKANSDYCQVGGTQTTQRFLHSGDMALGFRFKTSVDAATDMSFVGSFATAASVNGILIRHDTSNNRLLISVGNASGTLMVNTTSANDSIPYDVASSFVFAMGAGQYWIYVDGELDSEASLVGSPTDADGQTIARIGARGGGVSWYYGGKIGEVVGLGSAADAVSLAGYLAA